MAILLKSLRNQVIVITDVLLLHWRFVTARMAAATGAKLVLAARDFCSESTCE